MVLAGYTGSLGLELSFASKRPGVATEAPSTLLSAFVVQVPDDATLCQVRRQVRRHFSPGVVSDRMVVDVAPLHGSSGRPSGVRLLIGSSSHAAVVEAELHDELGLAPGFMDSLADHVEDLLARAIHQADVRFDGLTSRDLETYRLLNATGTPYDGGDLIDAAVLRLAERSPEALAITDRGRGYTYRDLVDVADEIAGGLEAQGCGRGDRVVVCLPRSFELVAAELAVLRRGAAYIPIDPAWPPFQVDAITRSVEPKVAVGNRAGAISVAQLRTAGPPKRMPSLPTRAASDPACIIFTSGSTGDPKGVVLPHRAVTHFLSRDRHGVFSPATTCLQAAPIQWDVHAFEVWGTLIAGGRLVLHDGRHLTPTALRRATADGVDTAWVTSSLLNVLIDEDLGCFSGLKMLMSGGERLDAQRICRLLARHPSLRFLNGYGPVEAGIFTSFADVNRDEIQLTGDVPIGTPVANTRVFVVRESPAGKLRVAPVDAVGEIAVASDGLALGYLGLEEETLRRFVLLRLSDGSEAAVYRTGDLGALRHDGSLCFCGRADRQIKLRGIRVEPAEIEDALRSHPDIASAAVVPCYDETEKRVMTLEAYFTANGTLDVSALRRWLETRLPPGLVPARLAQVDDWPLTPTGKLDVRKVQTRSAIRRRVESPPAGDPLALITAMMAELLGIAVGPDEDFFDLGADSLLATRLAARLTAITGNHVSVSTVIESRTPAALNAELPAGWVRPEPPVLGNLSEGTVVPLGPAQSRYLFAQALDPSNTAPVLQSVHTITGSLDPAALARTWRTVVGAHEALRTVIDTSGGRPVQRVLPATAVPLRHRIADAAWTCLDDEARRLALEELEPFDITMAPPVRASLTTNGTEAVLVLTQHHVTTDGWSERILLENLGQTYGQIVRGEPLRLTRSGPGYRAFTEWYRVALDAVAAELRGYWRDTLRDVPPLPPISSACTTGTTWSVPWRADPALTSRLREIASTSGTTLSAVLLDRFARALSELTAADDFAVGTVVSGRVHAAFEDTVGCFVNPVAVRLRLPHVGRRGRSLTATSAAIASSLRHSLLPFDQVVAAAAIGRSPRHPLFQAMFVMQAEPPPKLALDGAIVTRLALPMTEDPFEVTLEVWPDGSGLSGRVACPSEGPCDLPGTVARLVSQPSAADA